MSVMNPLASRGVTDPLAVKRKTMLGQMAPDPAAPSAAQVYGAEPSITGTSNVQKVGTVAAPGTPNAGQPLQPSPVQTQAPPITGTSNASYVGTVAAPNAQPLAASPFSQTSTSQDLIAALNAAQARGGSDQANQIAQQWTTARGVYGNPIGNGLTYGQWDSGRGKFNLPDGIDIKDENGNWVAHQEGPSGGAQDLVAPQATTGGATSTDPTQIAMRAALLKLLGDSGGPTSINDPALAAQSSAYRGARDRSAGQERAALAERAAASGLNSGGAGSGAFDTGIQGIQEQAGQDIASNDASLVGNEIQAKRTQLQSALQLAEALGAKDEANALQLQLANLDNQYRYSALNQQQGQFTDTTALNYAQLIAQLNRDSLLAGLGG